MVRKQLYVIAYDLEDDKRRLALSRLLENEGGERINLSVFECMLTHRELEMIKAEAMRLINPHTDQVAIYQICRACYTASVYLPEREPADSRGIVVT